MYDDDYVSSVLYRLSAPRRGKAADGTSKLREAFDAATGTVPAADSDGGSWPDPRVPRLRRSARYLGRALARVDVWILIATIAGVVIAYLTLVKH